MKKSKLINVYSGDWSKRLCNGCHERLLSLYEIKAGTAAEDQKVEDLVAALLSAVAADDQSQAELRLRASEKRAEQLSAESVVSLPQQNMWQESFRKTLSSNGHRQSSASAKQWNGRSPIRASRRGPADYTGWLAPKICAVPATRGPCLALPRSREWHARNRGRNAGQVRDQPAADIERRFGNCRDAASAWLLANFSAQRRHLSAMRSQVALLCGSLANFD